MSFGVGHSSKENGVTMDPRITITLDCQDPERLAKFWVQALGYSSPGGFGEFWPLVPTNDSEPWVSPALTDIHDRAAKPRKDVQNGDHGTETEAATAVVLR